MGQVTVTARAAGQSGQAVTETATVRIAQPAAGANKGGWAAVNAAAGPLTAYRGFVPPNVGVPATWPGSGADPIPPNTLPVISLNPDITAVLSGMLDTALTTWARQVPPGAMVTVAAEAEAGRFAWSPTQIRALHTRCRQLVKEASPAALYGQVVTTYTASRASTHYPLATATDPRWMCPGLDWYGLDCYAFSATDTPAANMGSAISQIQLAGIRGPWAVTELNTSHGGRAAWFQQAWDYSRQAGALTFCTFWDGGSYAWDPADSAAISALAQIAAESRSQARPGPGAPGR